MLKVLVYFVIGIFLDTGNHTIMLNKLNKYGVRDFVFQWFKSYLRNRKQYVYNNIYSSIFTYFMWNTSRFHSWSYYVSFYVNDL